jgi:NHL repeat/Bacterial Ig domain
MVVDSVCRLRVLVAAVVAALMGSVLVPVQPAVAAGWTAPTYLRTISGPSRPGIAAWGLDFNPVTNEFDVGDYVSNQIRRFSRTGNYLGDFTYPGDLGDSIISAVAVDKRDGSLYAASTSLTSPYDVRKYDRNGNFMFGLTLPGRVAWLTVDDAGNLWFPLAYGSAKVYEFAVNDATHSASQVLVTGTRGTGPGQALFDNGIDVASNGDVYVADALRKRVHVYDHNGSWKFDFGDDRVFVGDLRGVAIDDNAGRVYVSDAKGGKIEAFSLSGTHLLTMGSEGHGPGQFGSGPRQLTVTPDGQVWGADYSGYRVEQFDPDGTYRSSFPWPPMTPDQHGLMNPWPVAIDPANGDVVVGDHFGQRIQRFSSTGALLQIFGSRGRLPESGLNYPRGVAVDPATGHVWVLNAEGAPYLVEYDQDFNVVKQITTLDLSTGLELLGNLAYVVYRNRGIQVFNISTGALVQWFSQVGSGSYQGLGVDPVSGLMWVTIRDLAQVRVLNSNGSLRWTLPAAKSPTGVAFLGNVAYVTDTGGNVIIAYDRNTGARLGSFGSKGNAPGQLGSPKGIAVGTDGNLYVADSDNGRIQVFTFNTPPPPEPNKPTLTFTSPTAGSTTPTVPVVLSGTASDDSGIASVAVSVFAGSMGLYYDGRSGTWTSKPYFNQAIFEGPTTNGNWSYSIVPASYGEHYTVRVRATDYSKNTQSMSRSFSVDDLVPPVPAIDTPAQGAVVVPGPLEATGSVTDDGVVGTVELGLHDPATGMWWYPAGGWMASEYWAPATFSTSGSTITWSGSIDVGRLASSGPFDLYARASDAKGNEGRSAPVSISVGADTVPPHTVISVPANNQQLPAPATLSGTAADGTSVAGVQAALRDRISGKWWDATSTTWGSLTWNVVSVDSPGATTTGWNWTPNIGAGSYFVQARATDGAGNVETSFASARFSLT